MAKYSTTVSCLILPSLCFICAFSYTRLWKIKWNIFLKKRLCPICFIIPLVWHVYLISLWGSIKHFISFDSCITPGHSVLIGTHFQDSEKVDTESCWTSIYGAANLNLDLAVWHIQKKEKKKKYISLILSASFKSPIYGTLRKTKPFFIATKDSEFKIFSDDIRVFLQPFLLPEQKNHSGNIKQKHFGKGKLRNAPFCHSDMKKPYDEASEEQL